MITRIIKSQVLLLLMIGLTMAACEKEEIVTNTEDPTFTEDFTVTERGLVRGPDGRALQCYDLIYPVTLAYPDESTVEVEDREALKNLLKDWKENNPDATDRPRIAFPFEVELPNGNIATIEEMEDVKQLRENCREGRPHRPTKCYRLVYPVNVELPNGEIVAAEDAEQLHKIYKRWKENHPNSADHPELVFPFMVELRNGEVVAVEGPSEILRLPQNCNTRPQPRPKPCFQLLYPVSVIYPGDNGEVVEVPTNIAFHLLIKEWKANNPNAEEKPELLFPYDVRLRNGTVSTVESEEDLAELKEDCGMDRPSRPKCFRRAFPINLEFPNGETATIDNRVELHRALVRWIRNYPRLPRPKVVFPYTVVFRDGTTATVNNQEELDALRESCGD